MGSKFSLDGKFDSIFIHDNFNLNNEVISSQMDIRLDVDSLTKDCKIKGKFNSATYNWMAQLREIKSNEEMILLMRKPFRLHVKLKMN